MLGMRTQDLKRCHESAGLLRKMMGECNEHKAKLDRCLAQQRRLKQEARKQERDARREQHNSHPNA